MLKKTETEETRLFCHIFIIGGILIGWGAGPPGLPLATPMATRCQMLRHALNIKDKKAIFICMVATPLTPVLCTM